MIFHGHQRSGCATIHPISRPLGSQRTVRIDSDRRGDESEATLEFEIHSVRDSSMNFDARRA
jgi:hypothetical protein